MGLRLKEQMQAGLAMARWLGERPEVARVMHPALESDPGHMIWKRDFTGATSLFAIELKPVAMKAVGAMLDGLQLFGMGASWGGYESLALPFDCTAYRAVTKPDFKGPTIRFHIGLEDLEDLKEDLDAGFARLRAMS
jgi:cysteine-S-conjugate beta-lyase